MRTGRNTLIAVVLIALAGCWALALAAPPRAAAIPQWSVDTIHTESTDDIEQVKMQGDYVVWTTYSRTDGAQNLWAYTISTKQKQHLAGPSLGTHIDDEGVALDGGRVAWVEYLPGGDTSNIVLYDIATGDIRRLRGGNADMWDWKPDIQGDWVVWEGDLVDERGHWAVDPVVFAYRISTSGPIKVVRWRDKETEPYGDEYRSMDGGPIVWNGKLCWYFLRLETGLTLGIMDLDTQAIEWTWDVPSDLLLGRTSFWAGNLLFSLDTLDPWQSSLWLRTGGAAQPAAVQPMGDAIIDSAVMREGLMAWAGKGKVSYRTLGGDTVQVSANGQSVGTDGTSLTWLSKPERTVWWADVDTGASMALPGSTLANWPSVDGNHVAWAGGYAITDGHEGQHTVVLATQSAGVDFPDVPRASHPYAAAIYGMASRGIIGGYGSGLFGPADMVKRQQFAKMIVLTLGLQPSEASWPDPAVPFVDLGEDDPANLYPHEYVAAAYTNGITQGQDATHFAPFDPIKRAQVVTMIVRAANELWPGTLATAPAGWTGDMASFTDATHGSFMRTAEYNGLLVGLQGVGPSWDPWTPATRGEVAQMLWNLLKLK